MSEKIVQLNEEVIKGQINPDSFVDSLLPSLKGYAIQNELRLQLMNWGEYTIKIMPQFISCSVFKK